MQVSLRASDSLRRSGDSTLANSQWYSWSKSVLGEYLGYYNPEKIVNYLSTKSIGQLFVISGLGLTGLGISLLQFESLKTALISSNVLSSISVVGVASLLCVLISPTIVNETESAIKLRELEAALEKLITFNKELETTVIRVKELEEAIGKASISSAELGNIISKVNELESIFETLNVFINEFKPLIQAVKNNKNELDTVNPYVREQIQLIYRKVEVFCENIEGGQGQSGITQSSTFISLKKNQGG